MAASLQIGTSLNNLEDIPIEPDKYEWGLNDISSSDTGRTQDAGCTMQKNRLAQKRKISLAWNNPSIKDASKILKMTNPVYFYVRYLDVMEGRFITKQFYSGDKTSPFRQITLVDPNGNRTTMSTLSFDIIER